MKGNIAIALAVYCLFMFSVAAGIFAANPMPPGVNCPTPQGFSVLDYMSENITTHSEAFLWVTTPGTSNTTEGVISGGCTAREDTFLMDFAGTGNSYTVEASQYYGVAPLNDTHPWGPWANRTFEFASVPGYWSSFAFRLPAAPQISTVWVTVYAGVGTQNVTGITWVFLHLTPASALGGEATVAQKWIFGVEMIILAVIVSYAAYRLADYTLSRMRYRSGSMKKVILTMVVSDAIYCLTVYADLAGISWHLGNVASYVMILAPIFVNFWIFSIRRGTSKLVLAERHLPDVYGEHVTEREAPAGRTAPLLTAPPDGGTA